MRKLIFSVLSVPLVFIFLIQDPALANQAERELDPDKDSIVNSYSINSSEQWSLKAIDTPNISSPGAGVTIAIIDTGVTKTANLACHNFVHEYDSFWFISGPGSSILVGRSSMSMSVQRKQVCSPLASPRRKQASATF